MGIKAIPIRNSPREKFVQYNMSQQQVHLPLSSQLIPLWKFIRQLIQYMKEKSQTPHKSMQI